jgi:hypothetical protein
MDVATMRFWFSFFRFLVVVVVSFLLPQPCVVR